MLADQKDLAKRLKPIRSGGILWMNIVFLLPIILRAVKSDRLTRVHINLLLPQVESIMAEKRKRSLASSKHSSGHEQEESTVC